VGGDADFHTPQEKRKLGSILETGSRVIETPRKPGLGADEVFREVNGRRGRLAKVAGQVLTTWNENTGAFKVVGLDGAGGWVNGGRTKRHRARKKESTKRGRGSGPGKGTVSWG